MSELERRPTTPEAVAQPQPRDALREAILEATRILNAAIPPGVQLLFKFADEADDWIRYDEGQPKFVKLRAGARVDVEISGSQTYFTGTADVPVVDEQIIVAGTVVADSAGELDLLLVSWERMLSRPWRSR